MTQENTLKVREIFKSDNPTKQAPKPRAEWLDATKTEHLKEGETLYILNYGEPIPAEAYGTAFLIDWLPKLADYSPDETRILYYIIIERRGVSRELLGWYLSGGRYEK